MSEGYLIPALRNGLVNYVEQAVYLSQTIKSNDKKNREVAVLVRSEEDVPAEYHEYFDYIIELPYGVSSETDLEQDCAIWQVYDATPFYATVVINSCALMVSPEERPWMMLPGRDVLFPGHTKNFRLSQSRYRFKFGLHQKNHLPHLNSGVFAFNKTPKAKEFFDTCGPLFSNWRDAQKELLVDKTSNRFSSTLFMALVASLLEDHVTIDDTGNFYYTDITTDNIHTIFDRDVEKDWVELALPTWVSSSGNVKIGNFDQHGIMVYNHDEFLIDDFKNQFEQSYLAQTS